MIDHRGLKVVVGDSDRNALELLQIRLDLARFHTCVARSGPAVLDTLKVTVRPRMLLSGLLVCGLFGGTVAKSGNNRFGCVSHVMGKGCANTGGR